MADRPEIEEARQIAEDVSESEQGGTREAIVLAHAFLDLLGKQSEREKALRDLAVELLDDWEGAELQVDQEFRISSDPTPDWERKSAQRRQALGLEVIWPSDETERAQALAAPLPEQSEEEA